MLVRDVAEAARAAGLPVDDFLRQTRINGTQNQHLAEPTGFDSPRNDGFHLYVAERREPLPLDAAIFGDFLTLEECPHDPWQILRDYNSLEDLERQILGGAGILNHFTGFMLAFVYGRQRSYEVLDYSGRLLANERGVPPLDSSVDAAEHKTLRLVWPGERVLAPRRTQPG